MTDILMPALSPTMEEGVLAKWHVKVGDVVKAGDVIAEIETDKATMEVEAVDEGVVEALLVADGADVRSTRNLDRAAGLGETGFPRWQEAARYHVKALGADASVWNESGFTPLEQDIRCRPRYANAVNAELLVSIHNNGGGGTGTETLYDTNNGFGPESKRLADVLHAKVIAAIRRDYSPTWADRRVQGFNGSYGENRLATRPAVIMEIAFMDRPTPDNAALRDERFKLLVAAAIRDGIREYLEGPAPTTPSALLASGETNAITLSWIDGATNEAGFVLERKIDTASTWTALATLASNTTTYRDTTAVTSLTYVYRVRSFNTGGNTAGFSNEATAATLRPAVTLVLTSTTPATQTRDWNQTAEFALAVTDPTGAPVLGAALIVHDRLRNTTDTLVSTTADATSRLAAIFVSSVAFSSASTRARATAATPWHRELYSVRAWWPHACSLRAAWVPRWRGGRTPPIESGATSS
jgi:pyruvate/2-oxoglutarate dehydrogenase complex dihydrolipoamide acyltransferase (E2) component